MNYEYLVWVLGIIGAVGVLKFIYELYKAMTEMDEPINDYRVIRTEANPTTTPNSVGPMVYYTTNSFGLSDNEYRFQYVRVGNAWRAYIKRMPSLRGRDSDGHSTHRYWDNNNQPYICWNSPIYTLEGMQAVSKVWANSIQEYIATGKRFG